MALLHALRDDVLRAIAALEHDDEIGALKELERATARAKQGLVDIRTPDSKNNGG